AHDHARAGKAARIAACCCGQRSQGIDSAVPRLGCVIPLPQNRDVGWLVNPRLERQERIVHRRGFIVSALTAPIWPLTLSAGTTAGTSPRVRQRLEEIERHSGGRLGVVAVDMETGGRITYRADERFP